MIKNAIKLFFISIISLAPTYAHGKHNGKIKHIKVTDKITMLQAGGGNIAVSNGKDGLFVIDADYPKSSDALQHAIDKISKNVPKFLINTHWHFDHVGGNEAFGKEGTVIITHKNTRKRMKNGQYIKPFDKHIPPAKKDALATLTIEDKSTIHLNGEEAQIMAITPAHTDGDLIILWKKSNVIHTGDLFFNGFWPFIDRSSKGSLTGMIKAAEKLLTLINDETKVIPGHGPLATKADLENFLKTLQIVNQRINNAKTQGKDLESFIKDKPLADLEQEWGDGFLSTEKFIRIVY